MLQMRRKRQCSRKARVGFADVRALFGDCAVRHEPPPRCCCNTGAHYTARRSGRNRFAGKGMRPQSNVLRRRCAGKPVLPASGWRSGAKEGVTGNVPLEWVAPHAVGAREKPFPANASIPTGQKPLNPHRHLHWRFKISLPGKMRHVNSTKLTKQGTHHG